MKYRSIPKPSKTTLPEIKQSPTSQASQTKVQPPKLSSSRLSRQSSSIESTAQFSQTEQFKKRQLSRPKANHREMSEYLRRQTIQNTKSFVYNSQDEHIKRNLLKHNWIEAPLLSPYFDLKWVYTEDQDEIKVLTEGQYYNHFKNTKELTTKQCLLDNFKNQSQYGFDTSDFFPRAYDLGNLTDREDFIKEYEKNTIFIILKKVIKYLKKVRKEQYKEIKQEIIQKFKLKSEKKRIQGKKMKWQVQRKYKKIYYIGLIESKTQQVDLKFDLQLMCELLGKLSDYKRQLDDGYFDDKNFELSNKQTLNQRFKFFQYSQVDKFNKGQTPNKLLLSKLVGYHQFFQLMDSAYLSDGVQNIWIIKPSGCARGQGIYLEKDIGEAISSGMKISARLIQKYIERPLLYQNYKFDLRQWVLVKSFQPLQAYVFSHCYMRMCSQKYDLLDTKNLLRHLTNFSLNKTAFENQADSIYSSDHLEEFLASKNISWQNTIRPQINDIIVKTLLIVQDQFDGESKYCFELFGFDIMLDYQCKPWLLEVNLSPACTERASWLSEMLNQMTESMMNIIIGDEFKQPDKYKYELLINEDIPPQVKDNNLQVDGYRCNLKTEQRYDKAFYRKFATLTIQKFFRMFLAQNQLRFLRRTKYSIVIQKYWRGKLARNKLLRLLKNRDAIIIQKIVRGYIAKRRKYHRKRYLMATKIQCAIRMKQAKQLKNNLKKEYSALILQSLLRMIKAKQQARQLKQHYNKIVRIQRVWRHRYFKINNKAILIQKHIKRIQQRKRYLLLLLKIRCSIKIQSIWRMYKAVKQKKFLKTEFSALILQCLIKRRKRQIDLKLMKINDGLFKIDKVFCSYKPKLFLRKTFNLGILRVKAIERIQGYRLVIKSKRFLKRLKRLKRLIKLQATVRMHIQRQKYRKIVKRLKAAKKLIQSIRRYIFKKKILKRIQQKRMIANYKLQQQLQQAPQRPKPRMIAKKK